MAICPKTAKKASKALKRLVEGNKNFVAMDLKQSFTKQRMNELVDCQNPYVAILSCSDSRVPVEFIFDLGLGDIFVTRNAGNVLNEHVIGSLEYAVVSLGVRLIVILGHQDCGVIKAVAQHSFECEHMAAFAATFAADIEPALELAKSRNDEDIIDAAIRYNAILSAKELIKRNKAIRELSQNEDLVVLPAYYCLKTGRVEFLVDHQISKAATNSAE